MLNYRCPYCGRPLDIRINFNFEAEEIQRTDYSVWRYEKFFPYIRDKEIVTLGEGWTPLVRSSENMFFKLESLNPTGSFKDRGSTILFSALKKLVKEDAGYVSEDSSGNAGASVAAYATRAGLKAKIYVPKEVSGPKLNQIRFYGAEVVKVSGGRNSVAEEAQKPAEGKLYVGHTSSYV